MQKKCFVHYHRYLISFIFSIAVTGLHGTTIAAPRGIYSVAEWNRTMSCSASSLNLSHLRLPKNLTGSFIENIASIELETGVNKTLTNFCSLKLIPSATVDLASDASAIIPPRTIFEILKHEVFDEKKCLPSKVKICESDLLTDDLVNICNNTYVPKTALILQPDCHVEKVESITFGYKGRHEIYQDVPAEWNESADTETLLQLECRYKNAGEVYRTIAKEFAFREESGATGTLQEMSHNLVLYPKEYYERPECRAADTKQDKNTKKRK